MKIKRLIPFIIFSFFTASLACADSWIIPLDSLLYRRAEELFLEAGMVPPLEETPVIAAELKTRLQALVDTPGDAEIIAGARALQADIALPFPLISPVIEFGLSAEPDSESERKHSIRTYDDHSNGVDDLYTGFDRIILDFKYMYEINALPSVITLGLIADAGNFSLLFIPELHGNASSLLGDGNIINLPLDVNSIDFTSPPFRAIAAYYQEPFEFRLGRDKINLGPSRWGGLTLNKYVPYYDYVKARVFIPGFSLSGYVINLNPIMTSNESDYLNSLNEAEYKKLEPNGSKNGDPYVDRFKNLILSKLTLVPWQWFSASFTQSNLVGGRMIEISDFNPLLIFHNNYDEGTYSVPLSVTLCAVPYKGIKIYGEWYFYDAALGDESSTGGNPLAMGYQLGFTIISNPFFKIGPGRFRLDAEMSYVDPWTYGKAYDLRKFTSRIVYVEPFVGRLWVDYPLGFYLGPDVIDIHFCLGYGLPGEWEAELHWNTIAKGEIDLYGWGADNDYYHIGESGYALGWAPTGTVEWTQALTLSGYWVVYPGITVEAWYRIEYVKNRFNNTDDGAFFHYAGAAVVWKIY